jgi:hypothetical protein
MLFQVCAVTTVGIADYGISLIISFKAKTYRQYSRLLAEGGQYDEDGANIMIEHGWMEQAPQRKTMTSLRRISSATR